MAVPGTALYIPAVRPVREAVYRRRALAVGLGLAFAGVVAVAFVTWRGARERTSSELFDRRVQTALVTTLRELEPRGLELDPSDERRAGERTLTEAEVAALVPALRATLLGAGTFVYDPDCFYRAAPHRNEPYAWPEHPRGTWTSATNSDGAREDHELGARELDAFVLVAGDSQTEGM